MIGTNSMEDKKMKKITFAILAIAFIAAFNSCKEVEEIQTPEEDDWEYYAQQYDKDTPRTPGTYVMFGANTYYKNGEETRTMYSDHEITTSTSVKERIDWVEGDKIQIYCNQSADTLDAVYSVYSPQIGDNPVQSVAPVHLVSEKGLKWGTINPHIFHGIYPPEKTVSDSPENPNAARNYPFVTNRNGEGSGSGYDGASLKFITTIPRRQPYPVDMTLAGMVATTVAPLTDAGNVTMVFYPIVTTLQFDIQNLSKKNDITINSISIDGADVAGHYDVEVKDDSQLIFNIREDTQATAGVYGIDTTLTKNSKDSVRVVLFALPMDFTNAKLAIDMTVNGLKVTRKVALNYKKADGTKEFIKFLPTHKYNFKIRIPDSVVFDVSPEQCDYDVAGGTDQITVTSYAYNSAGEKTPVGWTATRYSIDGKDVEDEDKQWFDFDESVLNPDDYDIRKTMLKGWDVFRFHDVEEHLDQFDTTFNEVVAYNKPTYEKLKKAAKADDVDLSMMDVNGNPTNMRNTANCYMVHARGKYRFPMVYGNAIKNDTTNTFAFNPKIDRPARELIDSTTKSPYGVAFNDPTTPYYTLTDSAARASKYYELGNTPARNEFFNMGWGRGWSKSKTPFTSHFLSPFVNHAGNGITGPWLKDNNIYPNKAKLVWQDAKGLITKVGIDGDFVTFNVTDTLSNLVEGNALIAVTDASDNILWSWHIWITEMTEDDNIQSAADSYQHFYDGQTMASTIMGKKLVDNAVLGVKNAKIGAFLGFCDLSVGPREIVIEFVQDSTGLKDYVTLTQEGRFDGNAPIYQFGRKDPLQFQKNLYEGRAKDKTFYDINGNPVTMKKVEYSRDSAVIQKCIKNPDTFCTNSIMDNTYYNLWAARLTRIGRYDAFRADKTKTIYDPCPAGYRVPALADVAAWAGNNIDPNRGKVNLNNSVANYVVLTIEPNGVYVPAIAGKLLSTGNYGSWKYSTWDNPNLADWALWETASWVSTPVSFSIVATKFTENGITYTSYDKQRRRYTETFYYSHIEHCLPRWSTAARENYQVRFHYANCWMNEVGASRANAVSTFMVKERDTDTAIPVE